MEGRNPPPKAEHPWPGEVKFDKWKSNARHIAKWAAYSLSIMIPYMCFNFWLFRNETHVCGIPYHFTDEDVKKRSFIIWEGAKIKRMGTPVEVNMHSMDVNNLLNQNVNFGVSRVLPADGSNIRARISS